MQIMCPNCGSKSPIEAGSLVTLTRIVCARCAVEFAAELSDEEAAVIPVAPADERGLELFGIAGVVTSPAAEVFPAAEVAHALPPEIFPASEVFPSVETAPAVEAVPQASGDFYEVLTLPEEMVVSHVAETAADVDPSDVLEDVFASQAQFLESKLQGAPAAPAPPAPAQDYVTTPLHTVNEFPLREENWPEDVRAEEASDEVIGMAADEAEDAAVEAGGADLSASMEDDEREDVPTTFPDVIPVPPLPAAQSFDMYGLGVRLMRVSPLWLLVSGLSFISFVIFCNWFFVPTNLAQVGVTRPAALRNEATNRSHTTSAAEPEAARHDSPDKDASRATLPDGAEVVSASAKSEAPAPTAPATPAPETKPAVAAVAEQPKASEPAATAQPAPAGKFTLQVGSYNAAAEAEARATGLRAAGQTVRIAEVEIPKRGKWYRVCVGGFGSRAEAEAHGKGLRERGLAESFIAAEAQ